MCESGVWHNWWCSGAWLFQIMRLCLPERPPPLPALPDRHQPPSPPGECLSKLPAGSGPSSSYVLFFRAETNKPIKSHTISYLEECSYNIKERMQLLRREKDRTGTSHPSPVQTFATYGRKTIPVNSWLARSPTQRHKTESVMVLTQELDTKHGQCTARERIHEGITSSWSIELRYNLLVHVSSFLCDSSYSVQKWSSPKQQSVKSGRMFRWIWLTYFVSLPSSEQVQVVGTSTRLPLPSLRLHFSALFHTTSRNTERLQKTVCAFNNPANYIFWLTHQ